MAQDKAIVVGAGPGGLATAMLLAAKGMQVEVFERLGHVGGRTSVMDIDGFRFDRGPTFFLFPEILRDIFAACGRSLDDEVELIKLDPNYRLIFESGGHIDASSNLEQMKHEVAKLNVSDAEAVEAYLSDNRSKLEAFRPFLERPFLSHKDMVKVLPLLPILRPWSSVDSDLKRHFSDPRVRLGFSFQSKYLGMSPFVCPSLFTILAFIEQEYGVFHPKGGCGAVTQAMARVARDMGVQIHLNHSVEEVTIKNGRATGIKTQSGEHHCDALVINADFARAMETLVPDSARRRWTNRKLERKRYSCSTFMLYLGIEGEISEVPHHTIFLAEGYDQYLRDIEKNFRLSENPSFYVQNPCVTDPSMAPERHSALYVLVPVPHMHHSINWESCSPAFRLQTLNQLETQLGIADLKKRIRVERSFTPADWAADMNLYRGATFSLAHNLTQMLSFRPRNRFEDIDGIYLAGGGTHPGSGLPVIFQSAQITSDLVLAERGVAGTYAGESKPFDSIRRSA